MSLSRVALLLTVIGLPFAVLPARFEPYDPPRVGALALLLIAGLPALRLVPVTRASRPLYLALAAWALALALATLLALSPARALTGDLIRRMGLLTHLLLLAGVLVGLSLDARSIARALWLAGVIVSVILVLQTLDVLPNPFQDAVSDRPGGLIGTPPAVGGWLALALVWACAGLPQQPLVTAVPLWFLRLIYAAGLALIALGLVLTQARAGLLAAAAGLYALLLLTAVAQRWRGLAVGLLALALAGGAALVTLNRIDWGDSFLTRLPLIARLNPALPDSPRIARELIWSAALANALDPAPLTQVDGTPDALHGLRRWVGHGPESFEIVFRPLVTPVLRLHEGGRPIDRAHNDWLDTAATAGWLGVLARLGLWLAVAWVGWRARYDAQARVLLAVTAAHFVDLTFSFTSVLSGWAFFLAVGGLLAAGDDTGGQTHRSAPARGWGVGMRVVMGGVCLLLVLTDTAADALLRRGVGADAFLTPTAADLDDLDMAARLRPWDDRLWYSAANAALRALPPDPADPAFAALLNRADAALTRALALNPYDAPSAYLAGLVATQRAALAATLTEYEHALDEAEAYYAAAARLMPAEPYIVDGLAAFRAMYR